MPENDTDLGSVLDYADMEVIDERGYLFGRINIIDALVLLLVVAVIVAGVTLVTGSGSSGTEETQVIVFQTIPHPEFVINAIPEGPIEGGNVVAVREKSVSHVGTSNETQYKMMSARLRVELAIRQTADGLPQFEGERLYVGRELTLDFRTTIVDGMVVEIVPRSQ